VSLGVDFATTNIVDSKLMDNMLVFRTTNNQFYWISNITQNTVPIAFDYIPRLANAAISDYIVIPKNVSGSKTLELIIPDATEGFYLVKENKGNTIWVKDLN
jgi:hypothetical protein